MLNLSISNDIPFLCDNEGSLVFNDSIVSVDCNSRKASDMKGLWYDDSFATAKDIYFMYRNVCTNQDEEIFGSNFIRYDITVIMPGKIGNEYIKTAGHYHPLKAHSSHAYPEVYEVIHGKGHYLLQNKEEDGSVKDVCLIEASEGEKIIIPPGYGHVTINPSTEPLVMANLVSSLFSSNYDEYRRLHGAAFYEVSKGEGRSEFLPNTNYSNESVLRQVQPVYNEDLGVFINQTLYNSFITQPERFRWLTQPEAYDSYFESILGWKN